MVSKLLFTQKNLDTLSLSCAEVNTFRGGDYVNITTIFFNSIVLNEIKYF